MIVILLAVLVAAAYVGWHLWMLPPVAIGLRWLLPTAEALCIGLAVLSLTRYLDQLPMGLARFTYNVGNKSLIVLLYLLMFFVVADLLRLVHVLPTAWLRDNWWTTGALLALLTAVFIYGSLHYRDKQRVEMEVESGKWKVESKSGQKRVRLVAVSDLHLGYHNRRKELARWVDSINAEHPDAVLIAGDVVDRSLRPLLAEDMAAELRRIEAPVYACLGNHEYYADYYTPGEVERFFADAGIELLRDSVAATPFGNIIGRDDRSNRRRLGIKQIKEKYSVPDTQFAILLDHQPYHLEEAEAAGIDLQLSGHTHRGQVWPLSWVTDAVYECSWGSLRKGNTQYYISSGLGIWGAKYRIGTQSEYVVITVG